MRDRSLDLDPVGVGLQHGQPGHIGGDVGVFATPDGATVLAPLAYRRLDGEGREMVAGVQEAAAAVAQWQAVLDGAVCAARESGVSWDLIGWSVGTTGSGARKRWGVEPREP